jgi:hypothetical protein
MSCFAVILPYVSVTCHLAREMDLAEKILLFCLKKESVSIDGERNLEIQQAQNHYGKHLYYLALDDTSY